MGKREARKVRRAWQMQCNGKSVVRLFYCGNLTIGFFFPFSSILE